MGEGDMPKVEVDFKVLETIYTFQNDRHGNWIKRTYKSGNYTSEEPRKIQYY
jgi:hypothetical protein